MAVTAVTVTEFARGLSDFLSQVQYRGLTLDIRRGKKLVARVTPPGAADGFPLDQLDDFLARGPQLSAPERQSMAKDLRALRAPRVAPEDSWAS